MPFVLFFSIFLIFFNILAGPLKPSCKVSMSAAVSGHYVDEFGSTLAWKDVSQGTIITDTNYLVALSKGANKRAAPHEIKYVLEVEALKRRMKSSNPNVNVAVTVDTAREASKIPGTKIPQATSLVRIDVQRDPKGPYGTLLDFLREKRVGGEKYNSESDRRIVADAFFSTRTSKNDVPKFATGDFGIIEPLCKLNPDCLKLNGNHERIREFFKNGIPVSITDDNGVRRSIQVVPL